MSCYARNVGEDRQGLAAMQQTPDLDPEFRAAQIAGFQAAIVEDERQQRAAALNTAISYANAGNPVRARQLLPTAEMEPSFGEQIGQLKTLLERLERTTASASSGAGTRPPIQ